MAANFNWTDEALETLSRMWLAGSTSTQIAEAVGVSRSSVMGKVNRLGLMGRQPPKKPQPIEPEIEPGPLDIIPEPVRPEPKPVPRVKVNLVPRQKTITDLTACDCHWPLGEMTDKPEFFCGKPAIPGKAYCPEHYKIAHYRWDPSDKPKEKA